MVTNPKGESLKLDLFDPWKSGLAVRDISGLGPPEANINSTDLATTDGSIFSSARIGTRNIVFDLIMMGHPTIEDSRLDTYRYFPLKKNVDIVIETDNRLLRASGYVESNEPDIFSSQESTQISILCTDPYLYSTVPYVVDFSRVTSLFTFPFENDSLTEDKLYMGLINLQTRRDLVYKGDLDTGVVINIHFIGSIGASNKINLYNVDTLENISIDVAKVEKLIGRALEPGDDINISTVSKNRYVECVHNGIYTNCISAINKDASWFLISPGSNIFDIDVKEGVDNLRVIFTYYDAYGGI